MCKSTKETTIVCYSYGNPKTASRMTAAKTFPDKASLGDVREWLSEVPFDIGQVTLVDETGFADCNNVKSKRQHSHT